MPKINLFKYFYIAVITITSFSIVYYSGNRGVFPIDTFTFFESGYLVLNDYHPIKDFWIISGITGDYIQAFLFKLFGVSWNIYLLHSALINSISAIVLFIFFYKYKLGLLESFFFSITFAVLNYPVSGTPFTYLESYNFSLISLLIFFLGIITKKNIYFFFLPLLMFVSFLSMQLPAGLINVIIIFGFFFNFFFLNKNTQAIKYFFLGFFIATLLFYFYLYLIEISINDFLLQYILFPISVGSERIVSTNSAFESAKLLNKINFKNLFLDFKFIHFFLIPIFIILCLDFRKKETNFFKKNFFQIIIILASISFIFHQLITANQIFIFSLISILAGFLYAKIDFFPKKFFIFKNVIIFLVLFSTLKFHERFNIDRQFMEFKGININQDSENASQIDNRFDSLKWINSYYNNSPQEEIDYLNETKKLIIETKLEKMIVSHYQFFSIFTGEDLNVPNRWYFPNNTFPATIDNKYYSDYLNFIKKKILKKKIKVIFIVMEKPNKIASIYTNFFEKECVERDDVNKITIKLLIKNCKI